MLVYSYLMSDRSHQPDIAAIDAGAVSDEGEPARVADGRRDVFFDGLFVCNVANCARSLAATVSIRPSFPSMWIQSIRWS